MMLETVSGKMVNVLNPQPDQISIEDIAWHLSRLPRFCGATIPTIPYSVAQHSVQVMRELDVGSSVPLSLNGQSPELLMMHGLLHDAAEAYISDIPSPIKHLPGVAEAIDGIEGALLNAVYQSLSLDLPNKSCSDLVHAADMIQRAIEAYNFMYSRGKGWGLPKVTFQKLQSFEPPMPSIQAYELFLTSYYSLRDKM